MPKVYQSLSDFYPYYLTEHQNFISRALHFIGTGALLGVLAYAILTQTWWLCWLLPVIGYGFAWVGHFFFEKNRPATFKYPFFSLASDFIMFYHIATFQIGKKLADAKQTVGSEQ
jgi:hypothetical protein